MVDAADPAHQTLETQSKTGVGNRTVPAKIEVPLKIGKWEPVFLNTPEQRVIIILSL